MVTNLNLITTSLKAKFAYVYVSCKILTCAGLVRRTLRKVDSGQLWHTLQLHVLLFQLLIISLKVLRFSVDFPDFRPIISYFFHHNYPDWLWEHWDLVCTGVKLFCLFLLAKKFCFMLLIFLWISIQRYLNLLTSMQNFVQYGLSFLEAGSKLVQFCTKLKVEWVLFLHWNVLVSAYWYCPANEYNKITDFVKNSKDDCGY